jgi:hypothetical protein
VPVPDPISIKGKPQAHNAKGGLIEIRWSLSDSPRDAWIDAFAGAVVNLKGSQGYLYGTGPSLEGASVVWRVPKPDVEDAHKAVKARLEQANQAYAAWVERNDRQAAEAAEKARAAEKELQEVQSVLDDLD